MDEQGFCKLDADAHELACADLLVSHCIEHFALEQQWMEETAMPGRELHVQDHEDLLSRLRAARELFGAVDPSALTPGLRAALARLERETHSSSGAA